MSTKNFIKNILPARYIYDLFATDLAIDLGTANTLVYVNGKGVVLNEPSVVAVKANTNQVLAAGRAAKEMLGKTPESIVACRPLRDGVIANFELAESMLRYFIRAVHDNRKTLVRPRMIIGVPSGITQVERRAVIDSAKQAGAREVYTIMEPMAAAIGAGLPVHDPSGNIIVDIGGGTTEVAVITLKDVVSGVPKTVKLSSQEVNEALLETIAIIIDVVRVALENTPPELSSDLVDKGIVLAGGGSMLKGLNRLISKETGLPVHIADNPLLCVVHGAGKVLEQLDFFKEAL